MFFVIHVPKGIHKNSQNKTRMMEIKANTISKENQPISLNVIDVLLLTPKVVVLYMLISACSHSKTSYMLM